jgi:type IV secretory pathway VirB10-like protein
MRTIIRAKVAISMTIMLTTIFCSGNINAQVYKWTDKNGRIHYSDKPKDKNSKALKLKKLPTDAELNTAKQRAANLINHQKKVQEIADDDARDKRNKDRQAAKEQAQLNTACRQAKEQIRILGRGRSTYTTDKKGQRHYLSDSEKNSQIEKLKLAMKDSCKR